MVLNYLIVCSCDIRNRVFIIYDADGILLLLFLFINVTIFRIHFSIFFFFL